jgi:Xaa-Pro aminopeptidase
VNGLSAAAVAARVGRLERARERMAAVGVDALLLSHGADLPWLTGYEAMPLERLTMLVVRRIGEPVLVVPELEAPRVAGAGDLFELRPWPEGEDAVAVVADLLAPVRTGVLAVSDRAWASSVLALWERLPGARWRPASEVTGPVRSRKDGAELAALRAAAEAADRVISRLAEGEVPLLGRRESEVAADLSRLLVEEGHQRVNFAIVGSGPNAASPHHEAGERRIGAGETVVCDIGGVLALPGDVGYCSDITRTVVVGDVPDEVRRCYDVLRDAQEAAVRAASAGTTTAAVDSVARAAISGAGYGPCFIHRTGHGIGIEEHEAPYLVAGDDTVLASGHAFSVEPGIYVAGRFGMRLEDIVVVDETGRPERLNRADHGLVELELH